MPIPTDDWAAAAAVACVLCASKGRAARPHHTGPFANKNTISVHGRPSAHVGGLRCSHFSSRLPAARPLLLAARDLLARSDPQWHARWHCCWRSASPGAPACLLQLAPCGTLALCSPPPLLASSTTAACSSGERASGRQAKLASSTWSKRAAGAAVGRRQRRLAGASKSSSSEQAPLGLLLPAHPALSAGVRCCNRRSWSWGVSGLNLRDASFPMPGGWEGGGRGGGARPCLPFLPLRCLPAPCSAPL